MRITENKLTGDNNGVSYGLLEYILSPSNLNSAYKQVKGNNGAPGVDKMQAKQLRDYLVSHKEELLASIHAGTYRPMPVRRVEIPKDGGSRSLGIPTVVDRVIQQAISQTLVTLYERQFSEDSYGFRPKRSAHQALRKCREYISAGYTYAVDLDLESFFDTVSHSKLIEILSRTVKDGRVVSLVHKYLGSGVQFRTRLQASKSGVPQGGPLSPLLSNVMLNELDKELASRGHKFVRYADDVLILCRSKRSAERVMNSIVNYLECKLYLKVNRSKSRVVPICAVKFLGYSFYIRKGEVRLRLHPKSSMIMKGKIKELTSRSNGWSAQQRKDSLRRYITGWINYFKLADMDRFLLRIDEWYRRRLRMVIWKQWKLPRTKLANLVKLGIRKSQAWEWANTRKSYWRTSNSHILSISITIERLRQSGYLFLSDYYRKVRSQT